MRSKLTLLFTILSLFTCFNAVSQVNDAGLWMSVNLEKKVSGNIRLALSEEVRLFENFSEVGSYFTEISGEYKLSKSFDGGVGYRFTNRKRLDDSFSKRHRYFLELSYKKKLNKLNTSFRLKYQSQYKDIYSSESGSVPDNYLRTKVGLKYDTDKKYVPFLNGEMYFNTNSPEGWLFDNYRITAGIEYELTKRSQVELKYIFNREVQVKDPWTLYVIGVSFNYKL